MNLIELLEDSARKWPEKAAFVEDDKSVSYAELHERVTQWAELLKAKGVSAGSRVGLCFPNGVQYVALTYALWRLEAVVVPLPTECPLEELAEMAEAMSLAAVVSQKQFGQGEMMAPDCWLERLAPKTVAENHGLNLAFVRFTSGTTNQRKGVALSHETIRDRVVAANRALHIGPEDTVMWCLPMAHHFLVTIVLYLANGATIVLARHVVAAPFLAATNRWKGTVLYAAPFHFSLLARDASAARLDSVRLAVSTTCALPRELPEAFKKRYGLPLVQGLGIIELGLVCMNLDDPMGRWDSVGRPLPDYQVRITNPDADGFGEVELKGPGFLDGYAAPWIGREHVLRDGWFTTGDLGRVDAEGYLFLAGRKTAVINLAGRKVFPEEIEAVLNRHESVRESRVYGRLHPHLGEVVEAEIVLKEPGASLDPLKMYCREHLASYKIPARMTVVESLPKTAVTGKLKRTPALAG